MSRGAIVAIVLGAVATFMSAELYQMLASSHRDSGWVMVFAVLTGVGVMLASAWVVDELRRRGRIS